MTYFQLINVDKIVQNKLFLNVIPHLVSAQAKYLQQSGVVIVNPCSKSKLVNNFLYLGCL